MTKIKTIIVDDEPDSLHLLKIELAKHCPEVELSASYLSPVKAIEGIETIKPDLLFLDIEMPVLNGFELLDQLTLHRPGIIFITAYNQFAVKAFKFNAIDYIVKPVDKADLINAIAKATKRIAPSQEELNILQKHLNGSPINKIAIASHNGTSFIHLDEIIYAESNNNYSKLVLKDNRHFTISKPLKDIQEVLEENQFLRVHRQYIINLNHVKQLNRNDGLLTMINEHVLPIARMQKDILIKKYRWL